MTLLQAFLELKPMFLVELFMCLLVFAVTLFSKGRLKLFGYKKKKPAVKREEVEEF